MSCFLVFVLCHLFAIARKLRHTEKLLLKTFSCPFGLFCKKLVRIARPIVHALSSVVTSKLKLVVLSDAHFITMAVSKNVDFVVFNAVPI